MSSWTAEVTNDPEREHDLYVEILRDEQYVGRIQKNPRGEFELVVYGEPPVSIPLPWLIELGLEAIDDLG